MKFSVCTDPVFRGIKTAEAIKVLSGAGYDACEFWGWWDKDMDAVLAASRAYGVRIAAFCTKGFNIVNKARHAEYIEGLKESVEMAKKCGTEILISQVGNDTGASRLCQTEAMTDALQKCLPILEDAGITLVIEPLNTRVDHPGYFLRTSEEAARLIRSLNSRHIKMLFDIYHQQITEGNLTANIHEYLDKIAHMHAAGCPGRNELTRGEIHYMNLLSEIKRAGYQGYIGLEYIPLEDAAEGLKALIRTGAGEWAK